MGNYPFGIFKKDQLVCQICKKILAEPIDLPCHCTICHAHLSDDSVTKDGILKCVPCEKEFVARNVEINVNKYAQMILDTNFYLSEQDCMLSQNIHDLLEQFEELFGQFKQKQNEFELDSHDRFAEIKRQIDIRREELKVKIDEIALALIKQTEENESLFREKLYEIAQTKEIGVEREREILKEEFRHVEVDFERLNQLKSSHSAACQDLQSKLDELAFMAAQMEKCSYESKKDTFSVDSFGALSLKDLKRYLVSSSRDKTIKIWDFETNKCIRRLEGHTEEVKCLGVLSNGQIISGSFDKSIKIWDPIDGTCIKTLLGHKNGVMCLKVLLCGEKVASGSFIMIRVWDLNNGKCTHTLSGHISWVRDIISLPGGVLVSCSQDPTIKLWNLANSTCIKTLNGHTGSVYSLLLLDNNRFASCSKDKTIKIWDSSSDDCIKTLVGHTHTVWRLEKTYKHELISGSSDNTIKMWDLDSGKCVKTLLGHSGDVSGLIKYSNDILFSGSLDQSIKVWDLEAGVCTKTLLDGKNEVTALLII